MYHQTSHCLTVCHISASVYRQKVRLWRAGESCEVCECVSDTREPHVLCAPPCGRAVCLETLEISEATGNENKIVATFRRDGTLHDFRLPLRST